jgi:hypothetical protein
LHQAVASGCLIVDHAEVEAVNVDAGSPVGARRIESLQVRLRSGKHVSVKAREIILCCGPIGSSVVLLRSDDLDDHIGASDIPIGGDFRPI